VWGSEQALPLISGQKLRLFVRWTFLIMITKSLPLFSHEPNCVHLCMLVCSAEVKDVHDISAKHHYTMKSCSFFPNRNIVDVLSRILSQNEDFFNLLQKFGGSKSSSPESIRNSDDRSTINCLIYHKSIEDCFVQSDNSPKLRNKHTSSVFV
jgi:hypothetical protein